MTLKDKTINGLTWSLINQFSTQGISFVIGIILARLLSPADYGITAMVAIFFAVASVFINSGFSNALIRKIDRTDEDLSTVFYFNIAVSLILTVILYFCAPLIAQFYRMPILVKIVRVLSISFVIGSFSIIQNTLYTIKLDFKTPTKVAVISMIISGICGITMAYMGWGVWALVFQGMIAATVTSALFWVYSSWRPLFIFSVKSFKNLFSFGSKLLLSGLLDTIYKNIYPLIIGKFFSVSQLGYFNRAKTMVDLPSSNLTGVIQRVTFPVLSEIQHDNGRLSDNYRKLLRMSAFLIFPLMGLLIVVGKPLVAILLTEKWLPAVPYMQILAISSMLYPIHSINLNLLQVKGRSDLFLRLEIIKKIMITAVLFISISYGVLGICIGTVFTSYFALYLNTRYTGKLIQLGLWKQLRDICPFWGITIVSGIIAYLASNALSGNLVALIVGIILFGGLYLFISYLLRFNELTELISILRNRFLSIKLSKATNE